MLRENGAEVAGYRLRGVRVNRSEHCGEKAVLSCDDAILRHHLLKRREDDGDDEARRAYIGVWVHHDKIRQKFSCWGVKSCDIDECLDF